MSKLGEKDPSRRSIQEIFEDCLAKEEKILAASYKRGVQNAFKNILFGVPLFWPDPIGGYRPFERQFGRSRAPFTFSVAQFGNDESSTGEWKYITLLELLRTEKDPELCWLLLARWMKQEGIREPEEFLPEPILNRLLQRYIKSTGTSASDLSYWALVTSWKPYFFRLRSDLEKMTGKGMNLQLSLQGLGYESGAIKHAITRRSMDSAIIYWVAERRNSRPETLWNAYSRRKRKRPSSSS